jgi:hypothetical protein
MNNTGTLLNYIQFLESNQEFDINELKGFLNMSSLKDYKELKEKHFSFSASFSEAIMEVRKDRKEYQEVKIDYEVSFFYTKINVHRSTYTSWKRMGYFKKEFGPEKKRRIPVKDIEEFLSRMPKYKVLWEKLD